MEKRVNKTFANFFLQKHGTQFSALHNRVFSADGAYKIITNSRIFGMLYAGSDYTIFLSCSQTGFYLFLVTSSH